MEHTLSILFLGSRNACRTVMAEGLFRYLADGRANVRSAGVEPAEAPDAEAIRAMEEAGIDMSGFVPMSVADLPPISFDLVVTLGEAALDYYHKSGCGKTERENRPAEGAYPGAPVMLGSPLHLHWSISAPADAGDTGDAAERYRGIRRQVDAHVRGLVFQGHLESLERNRLSMERLVNTLVDGIVVHDDCRRILLFNDAAERITGFDRRDVLGRDCLEVFHPDGLCGSNCSFRKRTNEPGTGDEEVPFTTKDGRDLRLRLRTQPMELEHGDGPGLLTVIQDVTEMTELRWRMKERHSFHGMIGGSPAMRDVFTMVRQVTASQYPVLITGESGTGKELVAHAIHNESRRAGGPFVPINCGALPENILESELFGHVKGAFTGAIRDKKGRFELADGGTLFLDEVGELTPAFQVKLLRVLQDKRFERVGSEESIEVDVRVIAATNRDLSAMVQEGTFRDDLYYRLAVVPIHLPPLRERLADLPSLTDQILADIERESEKAIRAVSDAAMDQLFAYTWPGNVRELINALRYASVRCEGDVIDTSHLPREVRKGAGPPMHDARPPAVELHRPEPEPSANGNGTKRRSKLDRERVERALRQTGGNKVRAAKVLGVGRATLYRFLDKEPVNVG